MAECRSLLNFRRAIYRGFESPPLRNVRNCKTISTLLERLNLLCILQIYCVAATIFLRHRLRFDEVLRFGGRNRASQSYSEKCGLHLLFDKCVYYMYN